MTDHPPITPMQHADRFAQQYVGLRFADDNADNPEKTITYTNLLQAFQDVAESAIDEYVRSQKEKGAHINAQASTSQSPREAQGQPHHNPARSMRIQFFDGSDFFVPMDHPIVQQGGWKVRDINGVNMLIVGHGVPRKMFPLCNIKYIDLED